MEAWRDIADYEGLYQVSNYGRVRSLQLVTRYGTRQRAEPLLRRLQVQKNGYVTVALKKDGGEKTLLVHRLVLAAFKGPAPDEHEGAHLDGDRSNNRLQNLLWTTRKENHSHKLAHHTEQRGERCGKHKLTQAQVDDIRRRHRLRCLTNGTRPLAREYGVSQHCIKAVVRNWTWVPVTEVERTAIQIELGATNV